MQKPKLLDRWSLPRKIVAQGRRTDNYVVQDDTGKLEDIRADSLTRYRFFRDGKPSIPSRPKFTRHERKMLRSNPRAYIPRHIQNNDLVTFPLTIGQKPAFGVGRAVSVLPTGAWDVH